MSDSARAWLALRSGSVPRALAGRMESAVDQVTEQGTAGDALPLALAEAARFCMRDALAAGDDRSAALHLLAADALITCACEAAAEATAAAAGDAAADDAGDRLAALAEAFAPGRLAHLAEAEAS